MSEGDNAGEEMTTDIEGVVKGVSRKNGGTGKKSWYKVGVLLEGSNGEQWVNFPFNEDPGVNKGDVIKVRGSDSEYGFQVERHKVITNGSTKGTENSSSGGSGNNYAQGQMWGNASNVAASLISTMALEHIQALPLTAGSQKGNKAKRFDELLEIYDKLRVKLYNDSLDTARVLENVEDFGAVEEVTPPPLPDGEIEEDESLASEDEEEVVDDDDF